jgi:tetratricopeptide (TPR) repeat protein
MTNRPEAPAPLLDLEALIGLCVAHAIAGADYATFDAAARAGADEILPAPAAGALRDDADLRWRLVRCMARAAWRQMPQPAAGYATPSMERPERKAPCHCGSTALYKHCCHPIERELPFEDVDLLPGLLEWLPRARWPELAGSQVDLDRVVHTVLEWREVGRHADVVALLEPWFAGEPFAGRLEPLFDALLDAYTDLDKPRKKAALLDRGLQVGDAAIRSAALQRRVTMAADAGDFALAWRLFGEAQRSEPESPFLANLEVTVLIDERRHDEARERARFWVKRLGRRNDSRLAPLIAFLREVASDGAGALARLAGKRDPVVGEFLARWREAPADAVLYTLKPHGESAGPLTPVPALAKGLKAWREACPPIGYSPLQDDGSGAIVITVRGWLPVLGRHPELWNSFEALDALVRAAGDLPHVGLVETVAIPILRRAERLLRRVLREQRAEDLRLEWGWLENRPALSLLGGLIDCESTLPATPEIVARLEWLVQQLNPDDNQGYRHALVRRLLEVDRIDDALALCERYPDDFAAMRYNRALALYAAKRGGEALAALRDAAVEYPKPLAWLLKPIVKRPRGGRFGIEVGGDEEAWDYREDTLPLWRRFGALNWARGAAKALAARR